MKNFLSVILVFVVVTATAQSKKFTFKLGDNYELPRRSDDLAFFGNDQDGIINLSLKKDELTILRFNPKTLAQTSDKAIELDVTKNFNSEMLVDFGTNYYWIHSDWDKSAETEMLFYDKIDVVNGKISESNKKLFETTKIAGDGLFTSYFGRGKTVNKYRFNYSADHKKLLISYRLYPEKRSDKENYDKLGLQVFDENMKKIWGGEFTMPYTEAIMDNSDFSIDSDGNGYLLAKVYDSEKRREKDKETGLPAYHFEVLKFTKDSKKIISAKISLDNFFIRQPALVESSTHEMLVTCTYSKKANTNSTDGIFLAMLDANGKVTKYKNGTYEFPLEELTKFESARARRKMEKKDDYEANDIVVRNINIDADGSVFMACEEFFIEQNTYTDSRGRTTTTYTYYYNDILAAKINAAGQFEWMKKIPKRQKGSNGRGTMSFKLINDASGYYFLFLDNKKNMELDEDEAPKYHWDGAGGQVVVVKLDPKGVMSKELLFDTREEDVMIFPADFDRINGNQFIGRAKVKRNTYDPLLITVN